MTTMAVVALTWVAATEVRESLRAEKDGSLQGPPRFFVDLETADESELRLLPNVGVKTARAWREALDKGAVDRRGTVSELRACLMSGQFALVNWRRIWSNRMIVISKTLPAHIRSVESVLESLNLHSPSRQTARMSSLISGPVGFELDESIPTGWRSTSSHRTTGRRATSRAAQSSTVGGNWIWQDVYDGQRHTIGATTTLVLSHNKTLAAQLYSEFREFFPRNAVHYFVSYYDYYQPEAYIPQRDIYIEKDARSMKRSIDCDWRRRAHWSRAGRDYRSQCFLYLRFGFAQGLQADGGSVRVGMSIERDRWLLKLVDIQYERNDVAFERSDFACGETRSRSGRVMKSSLIRIEMWGDEIERISMINPTSGQTLAPMEEVYIYPAKHFVTSEERLKAALIEIQKELDDQLAKFKSEGKLLEAQRLNAGSALTWR